MRTTHWRGSGWKATALIATIAAGCSSGPTSDGPPLSRVTPEPPPTSDDLANRRADVLPPRNLAASIRVKAIALAGKVERAADFDVDAAPYALAIEAHKDELVSCFQGRPISASPEDSVGELWMLFRTPSLGRADSASSVVRNSAPPQSSDCVARVFGAGILQELRPVQDPVALSVWIDISESPENGTDPARCAPDRTESFMPDCARFLAASRLHLAVPDSPADAAPSRISAPRVRVGTATESPTGRLPSEAIKRVVRQNLGRLRGCYELALHSNPTLQGTIVVSFVIGVDGSVGRIGGGGSLPDSRATQCALRSFRGMTFPAPDGDVTVTYPFAFSPAEAGSKPVKPSPFSTFAIRGVDIDHPKGAALADALSDGVDFAEAIEGDAASTVPFAVFIRRKGEIQALVRLPASAPFGGHASSLGGGFRWVILGKNRASESELLGDILDR